jgi:hypothetical protein
VLAAGIAVFVAAATARAITTITTVATIIATVTYIHSQW